ncbi:MAG: hypothetical protein ACJZZ7_05120 [Cytophagales bacterium]
MTFVSHSGVAAANGALFSPGMKLRQYNLILHTYYYYKFSSKLWK